MSQAQHPAVVVVTGLGAVTGFGWGVEPLWRGLLGNQCAIREFDRFDHARHRTHVAAQVPARPHGAAPAWDRFAATHADRFALAAAAEALDAAGLDPARERGRRLGVFFGSTTGGMFECESYYDALTEGGGRPRLRDVVAQPTSAPAEAVARWAGARGPVETVASACAAATLAIWRAAEAVEDGEVDVAICGGSDSLCRLTYAGFNSLRAVDVRPCRPFRADREGLSLGEGAGVLVLERAPSALGRGVRPLAIVAGGGASSDAHHMTAPDPSGVGVARAALAALAMASAGAEQVAFWNAHGTGTALNDAAESAALQRVFAERAADLPATSTKGAIGHLLGSAGAVEALVTVLSLVHGVVPPTPGGSPLDPTLTVDLVVDQPRRWQPTGAGRAAAVSANFAFGGANAAIVLSPWAA